MNQAINKIIIKQLDEALERAYCPYSKFSVACVLISDSDILYCGFNIENSSYSCTTCAEAAAIANFLINNTDLNEKIKAIYLKSKWSTFITPCGKCRQILSEHISGNCPVYTLNLTNIVQEHLLKDLLPLSFKFNTNESK